MVFKLYGEQTVYKGAQEWHGQGWE